MLINWLRHKIKDSFGWWIQRRTNTVKIISQLSSFTGGGRPRVRLRVLFKAQEGTWVEPPTFRNL